MSDLLSIMEASRRALAAGGPGRCQTCLCYQDQLVKCYWCALRVCAQCQHWAPPPAHSGAPAPAAGGGTHVPYLCCNDCGRTRGTRAVPGRAVDFSQHPVPRTCEECSRNMPELAECGVCNRWLCRDCLRDDRGEGEPRCRECPAMRIQQGAWQGMSLVVPTNLRARVRATKKEVDEASRLAGTTSRSSHGGWIQSGMHPTAAAGVRRAQTLSDMAASTASGRGCWQ